MTWRQMVAVVLFGLLVGIVWAWLHLPFGL